MTLNDPVVGTLPEPGRLVNMDRYPLKTPDGPIYRNVVAQAQTDLAETGLLALPGFLSDEGLRRFLGEAQALSPKAFHSEKMANPYRIQVTDDMPGDHPARIEGRTRRHGVAYHDMHGTGMEALFRWPPIRRFVADILELPELYLHEDPSNAMVLQFYRPGGCLAWHFDRARFSTILQLQKADAGGYFEAAPGIRSADDENHAGVRGILLEEEAPQIRRRSEPGTFVIIFGQYCMHRVTEVIGGRDRISLILSYEEQPGQRLDAKTRKLFFGPGAPDDPA